MVKGPFIPIVYPDKTVQHSPKEIDYAYVAKHYLSSFEDSMKSFDKLKIKD